MSYRAGYYRNGYASRGYANGRPSGGTPDPWFSNGPVDADHFFGAEGIVLRPGDFASPNALVDSSANVYSPVTAPLWEQALTGAANDPLGVGFNYNTADSFDAANAAIHEFGAAAFAALIPLVLTGGTTSLAVRIIGKVAVAAPSYGWALRPGGSGARPQKLQILATGAGAPGGTTATTANTLAAGVPAYAFVYRSVVEGRMGLATSFSADVFSSADPGDMTNPAIFALGSIDGRNADGITLGPIVIFPPAVAETVIAAQVASLAAWRIEAGI